MKIVKNTLISWLKNHTPVLAVIAVALIVAVRNFTPGTIYSGWDNLHPEFDFARYVRQVVFGAWVEHHGLGAPAAQGQLSEIFRLPILFLFHIFLPANLHRYVFVFLMYAVGGIGMYAYLSQVWLREKITGVKNWLASLGGIFYLLHILTLQQFYISFEMFPIQFAFLPFLLLVTYRLAKKPNTKNWLLFALVQFLIAPSGHTPTVFYLGAMVSVAYAFFLTLKNGFGKAFKLSFLIGLATLLINGYWTIPSLYYMANDSHYVHESRDNLAFSPESVAAVREMGTVDNFLAGTHFLFNWKDYSFENQQFEPVFNEWEGFLYQPHVRLLLQFFGVMSVIGLILSLVDARKDYSRWAMVVVFLGCMSLLWTDLLPTSFLVSKLYESNSFMEVFRNPFTKLSIIYSVVAVLFFSRAAEWLTAHVPIKKLRFVLVALLIGSVIYSAWPSFQGHFINDRLKITYPDQYQSMFDYLKTRDRNLRVLQLPQFGHVGWEFYDWSFIRKGNGYQGMGFYMFGMPQAFLNRDADRWVETNDFFYHELKAATDAKDVAHFEKVVEKYNVDLLIVDETKIDPGKSHDFAVYHQLATDAGFAVVWQKDFLKLYERPISENRSEVFAPLNILRAAGDTNRIRADVIYKNEGDYVLGDEKLAQVIYPFSGLQAHQLKHAVIEKNRLTVTQKIEPGIYQIYLPPLVGEYYFVPTALTYNNGEVRVAFPRQQVSIGETLELPKLPDFSFPVEENPDSLVVFFNDIGVILSRDETVFPVLKLEKGQPLSVEYAGETEGVNHSLLVTTPAFFIEPDWQALTSGISAENQEISEVTLEVFFPLMTLDLQRSPSKNCSIPKKGTIETRQTEEVGTVFAADDFGVNCNGYNFDYVSSAYSYALHIAGENRLGRGVKFFVNYDDGEIVPEDYLMRGKNIDTVVTLAQLSSDPTSTMTLNWETRSFGKYAESFLQTLELMPLPIEQFSQLQLRRTNQETENGARIVSEQNWFDAFRVVQVACDSEDCFIGFDQSYDDAWIAVQARPFSVLEHVRLNTWANGWFLSSGETGAQATLIIFYGPEIIAIISLVLVVISLPFFLRRVSFM